MNDRAASDRIVVTPFFLDRPVPRLAALADDDWGDNWIVNRPALALGGRGGDETQARMSCLHRSLAEIVAETVARGRRPVSLCGDCCATIGVLAGLQRAGLDPTLIWFDAHGDFNTRETSPSGFLGGMPLAMLVGRGAQAMPRAVGLRPQSEDRVILSDARDLDPGERKALERSSVVHVADVARLRDMVPPEGPLYVHFDTDILTADEVPAQNYPVADGPSAELLGAVFERLAATGRVVAASLSSWNPDLDRDRASENTCLAVYRRLLG